ncbi:MAG TPA: hypothetical protein VG496_18385 [Myxococcales bacterium]|nr:hypothetical protein [Myxococcales bacterium]
MKFVALVIGLCVVVAAAAAGSQVWQWRERKLRDHERLAEQKAAETDAAVRLGLKTGTLPPHPVDRRGALDDALRLRPDRRFLLAAQELAGRDVATRFSDGQWIVSLGNRDVARLAELPDFPELLKALAPLAKEWVAAAKVGGKAPRVRALRGQKEALAAIRDAQSRWLRGDHGAAVLHDAASAAAALVLQLPRTFDADDRLDAHAIALCAADAAAGSDVRGQQAVLALALGYAGAARALVPAQEEPALHAFLTLDRRRLADASGRRGAGAGDRHLLLRWLMQDANEQAVRSWIAAARDDEHVSIPAVGQLLLDGDLQVIATATDTMPDLAVAELEGVRTTAPTDTDLLTALTKAQRSALQNLAGHEDVRPRLAADLRQAADTGNEGPLWRGADTAAWYAAAVAAALWSSARTDYVLRDDVASVVDMLGTWPLPAAAYPQHWLKARIAVDRGNFDEAYEVLATARLPGPAAAADLLDAMSTQSEPPDPRMIEAARVAGRHFDSRPTSRLIWAEVLRRHHRDPDRAARLAASVVDQVPGAHPSEEVALAKQLGQIDRLERLALDERIPFPARLEAAKALADRGAKGPAERALRQLARERPLDPETQERLIRFLRETGRSKDALAAAQELVRRYGDDDSFSAASARCAAARQLGAMGQHEDALAMVERALPTEAPCAYQIATGQLAELGKKQEAEGLLLALFARRPTAETAATIAEARWRSRDDAGAADILAHPPVGLTRRNFREIGERFAEVFRGRPAEDVKPAIEAMLRAGVSAQSIVELGPALSVAAAHAFEVYALLSQKVASDKKARVQFRAWSALRVAKGASAAEAWLRSQVGPDRSSASVDSELATAAYEEGVDEALWELFTFKPPEPAFADRLLLLRAASIVRRAERSARRDALLQELSDPLAAWKARLAQYIGLSGAYASWEVRLARYVLGEGSEEEIADDATDGSRPCEAPYYFGVRAKAECRVRDAAAWFRVALECRNPRQPELVWAYRAASQLDPDRSLSTKPLQASR